MPRDGSQGGGTPELWARNKTKARKRRLSENDKMRGNDTQERFYYTQQRRDEHTPKIGSWNEKKQWVCLKFLARGIKAQSAMKKGAGRLETEPGKSF